MLPSISVGWRQLEPLCAFLLPGEQKAHAFGEVLFSDRTRSRLSQPFSVRRWGTVVLQQLASEFRFPFGPAILSLRRQLRANP